VLLNNSFCVFGKNKFYFKGGVIVAEVLAPMAGKVIEIKVSVGDVVHEDDEVAVIEAMKMEMPIMTYSEGTVKEIKVAKGDSVEADQVLMIIE
jgi:acetyl-CoA carboxylase biotin carboxyl carrier protein